MKTLLILLLFASSANAETNLLTKTYRTHTIKKSVFGCYKTNGSNKCVDDTFIQCTNSIERDSKLWGPVIASFCDDQRYYKKLLNKK